MATRINSETDRTDESRDSKESRDKARAELISPRRIPVMDEDRVHRTQLFGAFLEAHYPSQQSKALMKWRASPFHSLPQLYCSNELVRSAVEAVCFAHFASRANDRVLVQHARLCHGKALALLTGELTRRRHRPQDVVLAILVTTLYDECDPPYPHSQDAWAAHYWGIEQYLATCGPSSLNMTNDDARRIFPQFHISMFFLGVAHRRATRFSQLRWRQPGTVDSRDREYMTNQSTTVTLFRHASLLPAILGTVDGVLGRPFQEKAIERVCARIESLLTLLSYWFEFESGFAGQHPPTSEVRSDVLYEHNQIRCAMACSGVFPTCYSFPRSLTEGDVEFTIYTMCCLILDCTLLRLAYFHPNSQAVSRFRSVQQIKDSAYGRAVDLCQSVYDLSEWSSIGKIGYVDLLVGLAHNFFMETGAARELGWCQAVECAIKLRLEELRATQPPSLCHIGKLVPGVARSALYRMRDLDSSATVRPSPAVYVNF